MALITGTVICIGYILGAYLRIDSIKKSDAGVYKCRAENGVGIQEASAKLSVQNKSPSIFSRQPRDIQVDMGQKIMLPCEARGEPRPTIRWSKDGHYMTAENRYK